jgi:hypothetical protein
LNPWISIPHELHIKNSQAWTQRGEEEYFLYRTHWYVKRRQFAEPVKIGEKIATFDSPAGPGRKWSGSSQLEWSTVNTRESITQILREEDVRSSVESELQGKIGVLPVAQISAKLKSSLEQSLKSSAARSTGTTRTETESKKIMFSWEFPLPQESSDRWVAASVYQRFAYDVYLVWADYLFVGYDQPSIFTRRRERFKRPEAPQGGEEAKNWIEICKPKFSLLFWELMPSSVSIKTETDYRQQLVDPAEIEFADLRTSLSRKEKPKVDSLYSLSNYCFPLKSPPKKQPGSVKGNASSEESVG